MLPIVFLLLMSALVSYESDIPWTGGEHLKKFNKNSSVNPVSEERRENRQMHFVDPSFSSPTLSSHNSLDH